MHQSACMLCCETRRIVNELGSNKYLSTPPLSSALIVSVALISCFIVFALGFRVILFRRRLLLHCFILIVLLVELHFERIPEVPDGISPSIPNQSQAGVKTERTPCTPETQTKLRHKQSKAPGARARQTPEADILARPSLDEQSHRRGMGEETQAMLAGLGDLSQLPDDEQDWDDDASFEQEVRRRFGAGSEVSTH